MAKKFTVTYTDGHEDEAALTMRAMCKAEQMLAHEGMNATTDTINATMRAIYVSLRIAGKTSDPFETWLDSVDDFNPVGDESADVDPLD